MAEREEMKAEQRDRKYISGMVAKAADRYAMDVLGMRSLDLMETASSRVAEYITRKYLYQRDMTISVLSGVGNNGADGVCVARMLLEEGYQPRVFLVGKLEKASWELLYQLFYYQQCGGVVTPYRVDETSSYGAGLRSRANDERIRKEAPSCCKRNTDVLRDDDLLIDAIFGIGLHREVTGEYRDFMEEAARHRHGYTLAIDAPSGIDTDTGALMGCGIRADVTITFGHNKLGLTQGEGRLYAGEVRVEDIGIPEEAYEEAEKRCRA